MSGEAEKSRNIQSVAVEIGPTSFHAVLCEASPDSERCRTVSVQWRQEASTLNSSQGLQELSAALTEFVQTEELTGRDIHAVLDGEYCVTRYVSGSEQSVGEQLDNLEMRSRRYLLLGQGKKVAARHVNFGDDGNGYGLVTVASLRTLETLSAAADAAGVRLVSISASVVMLAGVVHHICAGQSAGLLIRPRSDRADLAIVEDGHLLLDVRPVRKMNCGQLSEYVGDRLALLERFFERNGLADHRELDRIFVFGDRKTVTALTQEFSCCGVLVDAMDRKLAEMPWAPEETVGLHTFSPAIGACFGTLSGTQIIPRPDLLDVMKKTQHESLRGHLLRTLWPLAAAVILCVLFRGLAFYEDSRILAYTDSVIEFEDFEYKKWELQDEVDLLTQEITHLQTIEFQLQSPAYHRLFTVLGGCLADSARLDNVNLDREGLLRIHGASATEDEVYRFVENIERLPVFSKAALSGTRSADSAADPTVRFDVQAQIRTSVESQQEEDDHV